MLMMLQFYCVQTLFANSGINLSGSLINAGTVQITTSSSHTQVIDVLNVICYCSGKGGPDKLEYEVTIDFYADIDPSVSI